jgi:hypothetical protein
MIRKICPAGRTIIRKANPRARTNPPDYVTVEEAAEYFRFKSWQIRRAIKLGALKSYRFANSRILVRISDIEVLLAASAEGGFDDQ